MSYSSLEKYYSDLFIMWHEQKLPFSEHEALIPFERDIIFNLLRTRLAEEAERKRLEEKQMELIRNGGRKL